MEWSPQILHPMLFFSFNNFLRVNLLSYGQHFFNYSGKSTGILEVLLTQACSPALHLDYDIIFSNFEKLYLSKKEKNIYSQMKFKNFSR